MTNATGSPPCWKAGPPTPVEPQETIDSCYGSRALAAHGAFRRPILDRGIVCINALPGGLERKYGMRYSSSLRAMSASRKSSLTVRLCVPTDMPPLRRKKANRRLRGGLSTKIHVLVDGLGMLARFHLAGEQAEDSPETLP